jgi:hypothetical protein
MGIYKLNGCGNCTYDCCCKCEIGNAADFSDTCYDCKRAWSASEARVWNQLTKRERNEWNRREGSPSCPQCGQDGSYVNYDTRVPKRSNIQGWTVLKRVQDPE